MNTVTRREALAFGGSTMAGLAALLAGCSQPASEAPTATTSEELTAAQEAATTQAVLDANRELIIDESTGLLARSEFIGVDEGVQLADGTSQPLINFDNGATTPSLQCVLDQIRLELPMYGSIGRGKGQKSAYSTAQFNAARATVANFFGAPEDRYTLAFSGTATDALNKIAGALCASDDAVVITTRSEHHANDLPWRLRAAEVRYVEVDELGRLRMEDFDELLADGKPTVVSVQAASNVTGYVHDVHAIAELAHAAGAIMVVDGAQIASHRAFSLAGDTAEQDIDFFVCSAHKMYAPFGSGCIIGKTELMNAHVPAYRGGGMVDVVTDADVTWLKSPDLWEAGSPNYFGAIALAKACDALSTVGFDAIAAHEQVLLRKALDGLAAIPGVTLYADADDISDRVGVLTFNLENMAAADVAQNFADRWGIAVRQGEFCAHPLCHRLMGISDEEILAERDKPGFEAPAMVRASLGMYNTEAEIDTLIEAVSTLAEEA